MFVFIDESGDVGMKLESGSSRYFCIAAVIFADALSLDACDRAIDEVRRQNLLGNRYEFHFCNCSRRIREAFFRAICSERFKYHAFVINKRKLYGAQFRDSKNFYEFAIRIVCENSRDLLQESKVVIDRHGDRQFKSRLQKTLKALTGGTGLASLVKEVKMEDSASNNLVQLADMICGAVAHSVTKEDHVWRDLVKRRSEERVAFWPK